MLDYVKAASRLDFTSFILAHASVRTITYTGNLSPKALQALMIFGSELQAQHLQLARNLDDFELELEGEHAQAGCGRVLYDDDDDDDYYYYYYYWRFRVYDSGWASSSVSFDFAVSHD